jgi:hypothetical protein
MIATEITGGDGLSGEGCHCGAWNPETSPCTTAMMQTTARTEVRRTRFNGECSFQTPDKGNKAAMLAAAGQPPSLTRLIIFSKLIRFLDDFLFAIFAHRTPATGASALFRSDLETAAIRAKAWFITSHGAFASVVATRPAGAVNVPSMAAKPACWASG